MSINFGMSVWIDRSKKIEDEKLNEILDKHTKWIKKLDGGECANLSFVDLSEKDLSGKDLSGAILIGANLTKANLRGATLEDAYLQRASLGSANLTDAVFKNAEMNGIRMPYANAKGADFCGANMVQSLMWDCDFEKAEFVLSDLSGSKLCDCNFRGVDMRGANLNESDLDYAHFEGARLEWADFTNAENSYYASFEGADLTHTELSDCPLDGEKLKNAKGLFVPLACPAEGSFIAWKKCREDRIVKLVIPKEAKRVGSNYWDMRASEAEVVEIIGPDGETYSEAVSYFDPEFIYRTGDTAVAKEYDGDPYCNGDGIHFVLSRKHAEELDLSQFLEEEAK